MTIMYIYHTKQFIIQKLYYMCICTDRKELVTIVNFWRNVCYICTLNMNRITIRFSMCHAVFISIYFTKSIHQYNYIGSYKLSLALVVSVSVYALKILCCVLSFESFLRGKQQDRWSVHLHVCYTFQDIIN